MKIAVRQCQRLANARGINARSPISTDAYIKICRELCKYRAERTHPISTTNIWPMSSPRPWKKSCTSIFHYKHRRMCAFSFLAHRKTSNPHSQGYQPRSTCHARAQDPVLPMKTWSSPVLAWSAMRRSCSPGSRPSLTSHYMTTTTTSAPSAMHCIWKYKSRSRCGIRSHVLNALPLCKKTTSTSSQPQ